MTEINHCPKCASEVEVVGCHIEDRMVVECFLCGVVEIAYYDGLTEDWLEKNRSKLT